MQLQTLMDETSKQMEEALERWQRLMQVQVDLLDVEKKVNTTPAMRLEWKYDGGPWLDNAVTYCPDEFKAMAEFGIGQIMSDDDGGALAFELWLANYKLNAIETFVVATDYAVTSCSEGLERRFGKHEQVVVLGPRSEIYFTLGDYTVGFVFSKVSEWSGVVKTFVVQASLYDNTSRG